MKKVANYLYYHLYDLALQLKSRGPRESAILYFSVIIGLPLLPFVITLLFKVLGKPNYFAMIIVCLGYIFLIRYFVAKYFASKKKLQEIRQQFKGESILQRRIGYIIVIVLLLSIMPLFLFFLSLTR